MPQKKKEQPQETIKSEAKEQKEQKPKEKVKGLFFQGNVVLENTDLARELFNQSRYGDLQQDGKVHLSLIEGLFLLEKEKVEVSDGRGKKVSFEEYIKKAAKTDLNFWIRYVVFKDLRNRGYIVKTALKFGADFRVYDRGIKPGEDHAKWIVYPVHEDSSLTWYEFAAKNRVAHSTKKRLLLGVADDESDVSYWECRWVRP
jgi:tRNA-intron endonuclease, archaea type